MEIQGRTVTFQSLAGTGALRLIGECMRKFLPDTSIYLPDPTHFNHHSIFSDAGVPVKFYRYLNQKTAVFNFEGMMDDIEAAPEGSAILLHGCAHYPTGIDPTREQWLRIGDSCRRRHHLPLLDMSYQGLTTGSLEDDAYVPRLLAEIGLEIMVIQSYSKNLGLYNERIGALHFVLENAAEAEGVVTEMMQIILGLSASPLLRGSRIVTEILTDEQLMQEWNAELMKIHRRLKNIRTSFHESLVDAMPERDWSSLRNQTGLYVYLGLRPHQIERLRERHHVYVPPNGSLSLSAVSEEHLPRLSEAIVDAVRIS